MAEVGANSKPSESADAFADSEFASPRLLVLWNTGMVMNVCVWICIDTCTICVEVDIDIDIDINIDI